LKKLLIDSINWLTPEEKAALRRKTTSKGSKMNSAKSMLTRMILKSLMQEHQSVVEDEASTSSVSNASEHIIKREEQLVIPFRAQKPSDSYLN
jgi:hypothetical protein